MVNNIGAHPPANTKVHCKFQSQPLGHGWKMVIYDNLYTMLLTVDNDVHQPGVARAAGHLEKLTIYPMRTWFSDTAHWLSGSRDVGKVVNGAWYTTKNTAMAGYSAATSLITFVTVVGSTAATAFTITTALPVAVVTGGIAIYFEYGYMEREMRHARLDKMFLTEWYYDIERREESVRQMNAMVEWMKIHKKGDENEMMKLKLLPQSTCPDFQLRDGGFLRKEFDYKCTAESRTCTKDGECCEKICGTMEQKNSGAAATGKKCMKCSDVGAQCLHHRDCCTGKCAGSTGSKTCANW